MFERRERERVCVHVCVYVCVGVCVWQVHESLKGKVLFLFCLLCYAWDVLLYFCDGVTYVNINEISVVVVIVH